MQIKRKLFKKGTLMKKTVPSFLFVLFAFSYINVALYNEWWLSVLFKQGDCKDALLKLNEAHRQNHLKACFQTYFLL